MPSVAITKTEAVVQKVLKLQISDFLHPTFIELILTINSGTPGPIAHRARMHYIQQHFADIDAQMTVATMLDHPDFCYQRMRVLENVGDATIKMLIQLCEMFNFDTQKLVKENAGLSGAAWSIIEEIRTRR